MSPDALQAVIFDVDGVLVDSYRAHFESWKVLTAEHGIPLTEEKFAETFGRTTRDIVHLWWLGGSSLGAPTVAAIDDRKEALFREILARDFPAMDGARELLASLTAAGLRLAVGSSGPPENVELVLGELGRSLFDAAVTGSDVERGKPDPQVFLIAAERLGVAPEACVVIEDAVAGIEAARAAGMTSVALVSTGHSEEEFRAGRPDLVVGSLRELGPDVLRAASASP